MWRGCRRTPPAFQGFANLKLQWEEPVEFARDFAQSVGNVATVGQRVRMGLGAAAVVGVIIPAFQLFFFWLHKKDLGVPVYVYIVMPVIAGLFVYYLPAMASVIPCTMVIDDKGIHRLKPLGTVISEELVPWGAVAELVIDTESFSGRRHRVLIVRCHTSAQEMVCGLGKASVDELAAHVESREHRLDVRG